MSHDKRERRGMRLESKSQSLDEQGIKTWRQDISVAKASLSGWFPPLHGLSVFSEYPNQSDCDHSLKS